jgi:hypothetical protein
MFLVSYLMSYFIWSDHNSISKECVAYDKKEEKSLTEQLICQVTCNDLMIVKIQRNI